MDGNTKGNLELACRHLNILVCREGMTQYVWIVFLGSVPDANLFPISDMGFGTGKHKVQINIRRRISQYAALLNPYDESNSGTNFMNVVFFVVRFKSQGLLIC